MIGLMMYVLGVIEAASVTFGVFLFIATAACLVVACIYTACKIDDDEEGSVKFLSILKKVIPYEVILIILVIFLPSKETLMIMYVAPKITGNTTIEKDLPELYGLAVKALKHELNEVLEEE